MPTALQYARDLQRFVDAGHTVPEVAYNLGLSEKHVMSRLALGMLRPEAEFAVHEGAVLIDDALVLATLDHDTQRMALADAIAFPSDVFQNLWGRN